MWKSLSQSDKERKVKCIKHPFKDDHTTQSCTVTGKTCKFCSKETHHFLLCPNPVKSSSNVAKINTTSRNSMSPVLVQAQYVAAQDGSKIGTLLDLCSTDDYVTHKYAKMMHLEGKNVDLLIEGMGGKESRLMTKLYKVPIMVNGSVQIIPCYGIDTITSDVSPPEPGSYNKLCQMFNIKTRNVRRPTSIDLLLSMRQNYLHPTPIKTIGNMRLYDGPLGMVLGGSNKNLKFNPPVRTYSASNISVNQMSRRQSLTMKTIVKNVDFSVKAKADEKCFEIGERLMPNCSKEKDPDPKFTQSTISQVPPVYTFNKLDQNLDRNSVFKSDLKVDYEVNRNCDLSRLDCRTSYNLQVAGKAPKKSPECLKTKNFTEYIPVKNLSGEKDRSIYYFAKESEDKRTVLAQSYILLYESKFLMQTIPLFDVKYSGEFDYSKYSPGLVGRWQPIEIFVRDRSALDFLLPNSLPPPDRCLDLTRAIMVNNKMMICSQLLLSSGMLSLMTGSSNWHWQDLLTDILKFVMKKLIDRSEISLGKFLLLFEVDDGCWTEMMMI